MGIKKLLPRIGQLFALLIPGVFMVAVLNDGARLVIRESLQPEYRKLLSTAFGNVLGNGTPIRVMKVKTREGLFVEIYRANNYELVQRISLEQKQDGFFTYQGYTTNLVLADVDGDDTPEILAPGYDQNLTAHLNVYRFDRDTQLFHRLTNEFEVKMLTDL
jgi:hypothetical protein